MSRVTRVFKSLMGFGSALLPFSRAGIKRWRHAVVLALVLLGLFSLAEYLLVPMLVQRQVTSALASLGFPNATFNVESVDRYHAVFTNILGNGPNEPLIDAAVIRFTPAKIFRGQLGEIELTGAKIILDPRVGFENFGHRPAKPASSSSSSSREKNKELPFDRIVLRSSMLEVHTDAGVYNMPVSGSLDNLGHHRMKLEVLSQFKGSEVDLIGNFDPEAHVEDIEIKAPALSLDWLLDLKPRDWRDPLRGGGVAQLDVKLHYENGRRSLHVMFNPHDAWIDGTFDNHQVSFDRADFAFQADLDNQWHLTNAVASANIPRASFDSQAIHDISLSATPVDSRTYQIEASASAHLPESIPTALALHQVDLSKLGDIVVHGGGTLKLPQDASTGPAWRVDPLRIRLTLPASDVALPGKGLLHGVAADIPMVGAADPASVHITFAPNAAVQIASAEIDGCKIQPSLPSKPIVDVTFDSSSSIAIQPNDPTHSWTGAIQTLARLQKVDISSTDSGVTGLQAALALKTTGDPTGIVTSIMPGSSLSWASIRSTGQSLSPGQMTFSGTLRKPMKGDLIVDTSIHVEKTSLQLDTIDCGLNDIHGDIPLRWNVSSVPSPAPHFSIGSIVMQTVKLPGIDGSGGFNDGQLAFSLNWPIFPNALIEGSCTLAMQETGPSGELKLDVPEFKLADSSPLTAIWPQMRGVAVTGVFSAKAGFQIDAGRLVPRNTFIAAHSVHIEGADHDISLDDLDARINIRRLRPFSTPGDQSIYIGSAKVGGLVLKNGEIHFSIEDPNSIFIEKMVWDWSTGHLRTEPFRFDPSTPKFDFVVDGEDLSINSIFEAFLPGQVTGQGLLYGRLPVRLRWPYVLFGKGFLYSAPGTGEIRINDPGSRITDMLNKANPLLKSRALEVMQDFQYDMLKVDLDNNEKGLVGTVHLSGKGGGGDGQALNLNLSLPGLDEVLTRYLISQKGADEGADSSEPGFQKR